MNPICNCGTDIETTPHYFLHGRFYSVNFILLNNIWCISNNILNLNNSRFSGVLFLGSSSQNNTKNKSILKTIIKYIVSSKKFNVSLSLTLDQYNNLYSHEWLFYLPLIIFIFLIFEPPAVAGRVLWIRFRPSFRPFLLLSFHLFALPSFSPEAFWDWLIRFFLRLGMVLGARVVLCVDRAGFFEKNIFAPNMEKVDQK